MLIAVISIGAAFAAAIAFGTRPVPPAVEGIGANTVFATLDYSDLPPEAAIEVRDGTPIAYRAYPAEIDKVAILVHGSSAHARSMHAIAKALSGSGAAGVYALDMRGHGASGQRGDIDYIGQLEDDLADVIDDVRVRHPGAKVIVAGFSSGAGFTIRFAGSRYGDKADAYLFLAPYIHYRSPVNRNDGVWAVPHLPRMIALVILNKFGIKAFNHLRVTSFRIADPEASDQTAHYSYRLAVNFAPFDDYRANLGRITRPAELIIGTEDEHFIASAYKDDVIAYAPGMKIHILNGMNHFDLITDPVAIDKAVEAVRRLP